MSKYCLNDVVPYELTSIGDIIKDELKELGMNSNDLAHSTRIPIGILNDIINGKRALTPQIAVLIEKAIGTPAKFLLNAQSLYEIDKARKEERSGNK